MKDKYAGTETIAIIEKSQVKQLVKQNYTNNSERDYMEVANRLLDHHLNSRESDEAFNPEPRPSEEESSRDYENSVV